MHPRELATMRKRYGAHLQRREPTSILRPTQLQRAREIHVGMCQRDPDLGTFQAEWHMVGPTGSGKSVSLVDWIIGMNSDEKTGVPRWDKPAIILSMTNAHNRQMMAQFGAKKYREPGKKYAFNIIDDALIGVYDASVTDESLRFEPLNRHIVGITYDSFRLLIEDGKLDIDRFKIAGLDEVDANPRGPVNREFLMRTLFNERYLENGEIEKDGYSKVVSLGVTATHVYRNGDTIADYLYAGRPPVSVTSINQGVKNKEVCGYRNIVVMPPSYNEVGFKGHEDLRATRRQFILQQKAKDEAAIRILKHGRDPRTGKRYRDMKIVAFCNDISHSQQFAEEVNEALERSKDNPFAIAIWGDMPGNLQQESWAAFTSKEPNTPRMMTNAQWGIRGLDDPEIELVLQLAENSGRNKLQEGGRGLRKRRGKPHATIISFPNADRIDQVFGRLAGDMYGFNDDDLDAPNTRASGEEPFEWPEILDDLNVHYTTEQLDQFADKVRRAQNSDKKPKELLTVDEMAARIGVDAAIVKQHIYGPLEGLFDLHMTQVDARRREAEDNGAVVDESTWRSQDRGGDEVSGQRFAYGSEAYPSAGQFKTGSADYQFCVTEDFDYACLHALFGQLGSPEPYHYNRREAARVTGISRPRMEALTSELETAYHARPFFEHSKIEVRDVTFRFGKDFTFAKGRGNRPEIFFTAPGLQKCLLCEGVQQDEAQEWFNDPEGEKLYEVKTPEWLSRNEAMAHPRIDIHEHHPAYQAFDAFWKQAVRHCPKETENDKTRTPVNGNSYRLARKRVETMPHSKTEVMLHQADIQRLVEHMTVELGAEETDASKPVRRARRGGQGR